MSLIKYTRNFWPFDLDDFFELDARGDDKTNLTTMPNCNVWEDEKSYHLDVELPGMAKKDIKTHVKDNILSIVAERKKNAEKKIGGYYHFESFYGNYERNFRLDDTVGVTNIKAEYIDGILKLQLPKRPDVIEKQKQKDKVLSIDIT